MLHAARDRCQRRRSWPRRWPTAGVALAACGAVYTVSVQARGDAPDRGHFGMDQAMDLRAILARYAAAERGRASGGLNALAGFDVQLRQYIAAIAEALAQNASGARDATGLMEALSDLTLPTSDDGLVCVQVKRTLDRASLLAAAREAQAIDAFMAREFPDCRDRLRFGIVAQRGKALDWSSLSTAADVADFVRKRDAAGHLLPPRIEADPDARTLRALWNVLPDPYAFLDRALNRALAMGVGPQAAPELREHLIRDFTAARAAADNAAMPGEWLTPESFALDDDLSNRYAVGSRITLPRYRDAQYMARPQILDPLMQGWLAPLRERLAPRDKLDVFWLQGRSGAGKSVLLLQLLERLVADGLKVLWLDDNDAALETVLHLYRRKQPSTAHALPDVIAVDDLHAPGKRATNQIRELARWIDQQGFRDWPVLLTCGPDDLARDFDQDCAGEGFALHTATVPQVAAEESRRLRSWYEQRFDVRAAAPEAAFAQAERENAGLFVSMAVELAEGDLRGFARRFADRIRQAGLDRALTIPLALNRLYLTAPHAWLDRDARERLDALNHNQDFQLSAEGTPHTRALRLTHPHLADAIYRALRTPASPLAYSHDLDAAFTRAMAEDSPELAFGLLQQCTQSEGLLAERVAQLDRGVIAHWPRVCIDWLEANPAHLLWSRHWSALQNGEPPLPEQDRHQLHTLGVRWVSAAEHSQGLDWSFVFQALRARAPDDIGLLDLGQQWLRDPRHEARADWNYLFQDLLARTPNDVDLQRLGRQWLSRHKDDGRNDWAFVYQALLAQSPDNEALRSIGCEWLKQDGQDAREDWPYIWRALLVQAPRDKALRFLGRQWIYRYADHARESWGVVYETLLALEPGDDALRSFGIQWLKQAEKNARKSWAFVHQHLLPKRPGDHELHSLGHDWLKRHARDDWAFVYRALLAMTPRDRELRSLGSDWLKRHAHDACDAWAFVYEDLLAHAPTDDALGALGRQWLNQPEHNTREDWAFVYRALLAHAPDDDALHALGRQWLNHPGNDTRQDWTFVYQALIAQLPGDTSLLDIGHHWLATKERDQVAGWEYVWNAWMQAVSAHMEQQPRCQHMLELGSQGQGRIEVGGIYRGRVNAHSQLGLFVMIGARSALLHETHFPPEVDLRDRYPVGSHLRVRVISNDFDARLGKSRLRLEYLLPMRLHRPGED